MVNVGPISLGECMVSIFNINNGIEELIHGFVKFVIFQSNSHVWSIIVLSDVHSICGSKSIRMGCWELSLKLSHPMVIFPMPR
jgi:hypothetical protein